ncbi:hypothetical protein HZS_6767 [Henneguya salminicola]|nr:hypothetical protein HZS_6767 [Henneguya salminicola]
MSPTTFEDVCELFSSGNTLESLETPSEIKQYSILNKMIYQEKMSQKIMDQIIQSENQYFEEINFYINTYENPAKMMDIIEILTRSVQEVEKNMRYCDNYERMCKLHRIIEKSSSINLFLPGRRLIHETNITRKFLIFDFHTKILLFNDIIAVLVKRFKKYTTRHVWRLVDCKFEYEYMGHISCYFSNGVHVCGSPANIKVGTISN